MIKIFLIFLLWFFLFPIYRDRVPSFGCFDDCFNYMGGYFLNAGKDLYSEIFYNHQPILAYLSAIIQKIGNPQTIYSLVLAHRLFVLAWSFIWSIILVVRFGWVGVGFAFLYETTKGYLFGERFLAESLIVYPIVYLVGLVGKKISSVERVAAPLLVWFIVFSREPYVPLALVLLFLVKPSKRIFLVVSLLTIFAHNSRDYFFNVVTINTALAASVNIFQSFAYPILIFFQGNWNLFRQIEIMLAIFFWIGVIKRPQMLPFLLLGLANIRAVPPGTIYYEAFHHLVGYAVLLFITVRNLRNILWLGFVGLVAFSIFHPRSYLHDRVDRVSEFTQNYSIYYVTGSVVRLLSEPADTLFVDGIDDLIYWEAKRLSPYPYSWYTSFMHKFQKYTDARVKMFSENPPDFYYGCSEEPKDYVRFSWQGNPTCLYVHKNMYARIPTDKLEAVARQFEYSVR